MRSAYWYKFQDLLYQMYYYDSYRDTSHRIDTVITVLCAVFSSASIAAWTFWKVVPWLWSIVLAVCQCLQIVHSFLPHKKHVESIGYLLPELRRICDDMHIEWLMLPDEDEQIAKLLAKHIQEVNELEARYILPNYFPPRKNCQSHAERERHLFCQNNFPEESNHEESSNP